MVLADDFDYKHLQPLKQGGTGSLSDKEVQPDFLPDCFESGTLNVAGLSGLQAGVDFVLDYNEGDETIWQHKMKLVRYFIKEARLHIPGFVCYSNETDPNSGVVAFNLSNKSVSEVAQNLSDQYQIMCRSGLHCSPLAHKTIGTFPEGTLRFGFSIFNTEAEIDEAVKALKNIAEQ